MAAAGILGVYKYLDDLESIIHDLKKNQIEDFEVYSPTSYHEIEHAFDFKPSPIRYFTLVGACTGTFTGFAMPLLLDWDWPIVVGGKTAGIYSVPAYFILGFELSILFGAIATILGVLVYARIPNPKKDILDKRFTNDHFGVFVRNAEMGDQTEELLKQHGAIEVREVVIDA